MDLQTGEPKSWTLRTGPYSWKLWTLEPWKPCSRNWKSLIHRLQLLPLAHALSSAHRPSNSRTFFSQIPQTRSLWSHHSGSKNHKSGTWETGSTLQPQICSTVCLRPQSRHLCPQATFQDGEAKFALKMTRICRALAFVTLNKLPNLSEPQLPNCKME